MIEYVIASNPDDRILRKARQIITDGGLICFPTDTSWIVAASPFQKKAVEKIYRLKKEDKFKHFSLLSPSLSKASEIAIIDNATFRQMNKMIPGHFTFILNATKKISKAMSASKTDKEVGLRFPPNPLAQSILQAIDDVLVSTNITHELIGVAEEQEIYGYLIDDKLSHCIDLILDPGEVEFSGLSTIIDYTSGAPELIRQGAGDL